MKKYYPQFRVMLTTFALGLAGVLIFSDLLNTSGEISVILPQIESESPLVVFPREEKSIPYCGGSVGEREENFYTCNPSVSRIVIRKQFDR